MIDFIKRHKILSTIVALIAAAAINAVAAEAPSAPAPVVTPSFSASTNSVLETIKNDKTAAQPAVTQTLSNNNYYTNVDNDRVHSPAYSDDIPVGASAECRDGTYSFSRNRRGTCSHHGGVAEWL